MIILGFFLYLHKNIHVCRGYLSEAPQQGTYNELPQHMQKWKTSKKLSQKYHQILLLYPCHAEKIKMPRPLLISSQSDYLIQVFDTNSHI